MDKIIHNYNYSIPNIYKNMASQIYAEIRSNEELPIVLCIGSDKYTVDCLGPVVGEFLTNVFSVPTYVYGNIQTPITSKNLDITMEFIKLMHPNRKVLVIDASVGAMNEFGFVKIINDGIYPGIAVNKKFEKAGDISIMGIVAEKTFEYKHLLCSTRLNTVFKMASVISRAIVAAFIQYKVINDKRVA